LTKQIRPIDIKQIQHYKKGVLGNNHIKDVLTSVKKLQKVLAKSV